MANLESADNNQVSMEECGMSWCTSSECCAGLSGGLAKESKYIHSLHSVEDTAVEIIDAIKGWHTSKGNNPSTGIPNPTIICTEWSYFTTFS